MRQRGCNAFGTGNRPDSLPGPKIDAPGLRLTHPEEAGRGLIRPGLALHMRF